MKKIDSENIVRFRTSWIAGDESAVVGFTGDLPLNTPIMFVRSEEGRFGWKTVKLDENKIRDILHDHLLGNDDVEKKLARKIIQLSSSERE